MFVSNLRLDDFRSYTQVEVSFVRGINVLVGTNGQGKTNLVEAIAYLSTFSSHRVAQDAPLVRNTANSAVISLRLNEGKVAGDHAREIELVCEVIPGKSNRVQLNGAPQSKARDLLGILQCVVFAPEDLNMVKGNPSDRRAFMDDTITQLHPAYASIRADLEKILKQRNALLKSGHFHQDVDFMRTLDVWDGQLARTGAQVLAARLRMVSEMKSPAAAAYTRVSNDRGPLEIAYQTSLDIPADADVQLCEAALNAALSASRKQEIERGVTLVGPHRDELEIGLRGLPLRGYASHGESWSAALALKLAVFELLRKSSRHGDPVLILDDVFAELDELRRERLVQEVKDAEQVIVTAAVRSDVPESLSGALFDVHDGTVNRVA